MRINDRDDVSHTDLVRILGTTAVAAMRGGRLTTAQKARIERVLEKAREREAAKRK